MRIGSPSWCAIALFMSVAASANETLPELLIPVDEEIQAKFATRSNFDLREVTYFAKRYRIVQVNFDLLDKQKAEFTITPFANAQVTVEVTDVSSPASFGASREWQGTLKSPRIKPQVVHGEIDQTQLEELANKIIFWVSNEPIDVPPALIRELESESSKPPLISNAPGGSNAAGDTAVMKIKTPTLSGKWLVPSLRNSMRVMPVPEDPRYHVVYEEDPERAPRGKDFEARRRAYGQFREALEIERKQFESTRP